MDSFDEIKALISQLSQADKKLFADKFQQINKQATALINNKQLYKLYKLSRCEKYENIVEALNNYTSDNILVYFTELEVYGIFEVDAYYNMVKKLMENEEDNDIKIPFTPKQIVLSGNKQKIIMLCTNENIDKIKNYANEFFKSGVIVKNNSADEIEIMVENKLIDNSDDVAKLFKEFYGYIYKKDKQLTDNIKLPKIHMAGDKQYICKNISADNYLSNVNDIIKLLATHNPAANIQVNVMIGGGQVINGDFINKLKPDDSAKEWVKNNPPNDHEITTDYYKRYLNIFKKGISVQKFTKYVVNSGFDKKSNGKERYWIKK
ncbi:Hypothetical protein PACV_251 [Pacmanvirus A23]|uniref:Hypothetical protein n=1 Tax=Pacmanvirus A23 TaxID=1932881 RepID=UPI000A093BBD|nr:Hypothetical protein B9W72_gp249 [Pacmanvirus A23]SIP85966.1 Hypothetical protein PACV_251 [Pacmanvirus A23]